MSEQIAPETPSDPPAARAFYYVGAFTPAMAAVASLTLGRLDPFVVSSAFCLNSFSLPLICFYLIWCVLNFKGRRLWAAWGLLALNAAILLYLAWHKALIWIAVFYD